MKMPVNKCEEEIIRGRHVPPYHVTRVLHQFWKFVAGWISPFI